LPVPVAEAIAVSTVFLEIVGRPDTYSQCNRFRLQLGGLPVQILSKLLHPHLVLGGRRKARVTTGAIGSVPSPAGFRFQLGRLLHFQPVARPHPADRLSSVVVSAQAINVSANALSGMPASMSAARLEGRPMPRTSAAASSTPAERPTSAAL
jgi:hypothetical protein